MRCARDHETGSCDMEPDDRRIIRLDEVIERTGLPRSSLYHAVQAGDFPPPVRTGTRRVGWRLAEVIAWIDSRPSTRGGWQRSR